MIPRVPYAEWVEPADPTLGYSVDDGGDDLEKDLEQAVSDFLEVADPAAIVWPLEVNVFHKMPIPDADIESLADSVLEHLMETIAEEDLAPNDEAMAIGLAPAKATEAAWRDHARAFVRVILSDYPVWWSEAVGVILISREEAAEMCPEEVNRE